MGGEERCARDPEGSAAPRGRHNREGKKRQGGEVGDGAIVEEKRAGWESETGRFNGTREKVAEVHRNGLG